MSADSWWIHPRHEKKFGREQLPVTKAKTLNDNIWSDDCSEVLLAKIDDLEHPKEFAFNLAGLCVASQIPAITGGHTIVKRSSAIRPVP